LRLDELPLLRGVQGASILRALWARALHLVRLAFSYGHSSASGLIGILAGMEEIEVKAVLKDKDGVIAKLKELGCEFGSAVVQEDTIYAKEVGSLSTFLSNELFLRLRVHDGGKVIFTAKYHKDRERSLLSAPTEHEVGVDDRDTMERILMLQGYQEAMRVNKKRMTGHYKQWEICLDEVEGLGSFIEVEQLADTSVSVKEVQDAMYEFLATLGIEKEEGTVMRYDIMLLNKNT